MKKILTGVTVFLLVLGVIAIPILSKTVDSKEMEGFLKSAKEETQMKPLANVATVSTNKLTVSPGETFDVSVTLTDNSIGWGILYDKKDGGLIKSEEIIETVPENQTGSAGYIFLIQITGNPKVYNSGTVIATKRYTVSETATIGSSITIDVTGDISGAKEEFNTVDGSVTVKVAEKDNKTDVIVKYVDKANNNTVLSTLQTVQAPVGSTYEYTVPATFTYNGAWKLTDTENLNRTHQVVEGQNVILVEYEKVMTNVIVKYVNKDNNTEVISTLETVQAQVGTTYNYTVPVTFTYNGLWGLTNTTLNRTHQVVEGENIILVEFQKVMTDVIVKYVDKTSSNTVLSTLETVKAQVGTTYSYTVPATFTYNGEWKLADAGNLNRTHTVVVGTNNIVVEYEKVMATVTVKYVDKSDSSVILNTPEPAITQVGTTYSYTVPEEIKSENAIWKTDDFGAKTYTVIAGENEIEIAYMNITKQVEDIVSDKYPIEKIEDVNYVDIEEGTTISDIKELLGLGEDYKVEVTNINGQNMADDKIAATGSQIKISSQNDNLIASYTLVVKGDVTGEGRVNLYDIVRLINLTHNQDETFEWNMAIKKAAKCSDTEGEPEIADIERLISYCFDERQW